VLVAKEQGRPFAGATYRKQHQFSTFISIFTVKLFLAKML
jgi:hypothetical protein